MSENRLTKADLINHLAAGMNLGKTQAEMAVGILFREMERRLQQGDVVNIPGIGTLTPFTTQPKKGRNPRTGEPCDIPPQQRVRFRISATLRNTLNGHTL